MCGRELVPVLCFALIFVSLSVVPYVCRARAAELLHGLLHSRERGDHGVVGVDEQDPRVFQHVPLILCLCIVSLFPCSSNASLLIYSHCHIQRYTSSSSERTAPRKLRKAKLLLQLPAPQTSVNDSLSCCSVLSFRVFACVYARYCVCDSFRAYCRTTLGSVGNKSKLSDPSSRSPLGNPP